jgi:pimeloyl-ACP methyl ester carboxylesterase
MSLLAQFQVPVEQLQQVSAPTLILASAKDRLLPSLAEAFRLKGVFQKAQVVILPESGHTCLLESEVNLYEIMKEYGFLESSYSSNPALTN